jgi:hypothetical protein
MVKFTVNLMVMDRSTWELNRSSMPKPPQLPKAGIYGWGEWHERIGHLMPDHTDHWWELTTDTEQSRAGEGVISALRDWGLPALRNQLQ